MVKKYSEQHYQGLFTRHVDIDDSGCHLWNAGTNNIGYGMFKHHNKMRTTHRLVMEWEGHDIEGKTVYHTCDNYNCVNVKHLRVGTTLDKSNVMHSKGRSGLSCTDPTKFKTCKICGHVANAMVIARFHNDKCTK